MPFANKRELLDYKNNWIKKRRNDWVQENGPCKLCGSWEDLEVDHIRPEEKECHRIWSWRESRRLEELAKCQVLCHDCHLEKTRKEKAIPEEIMRAIQSFRGSKLSPRAIGKIVGRDHKVVRKYLAKKISED